MNAGATITRTSLSAALLLALSLASGPASASGLRAPEAQGDPAARPRVRSLRIQILSTMLASQGIGEWGFSALVEADGHRLLFDTGNEADTVLRNVRTMGVDLRGVRDVLLSHHHRDHRGGLLALRRDVLRTDAVALSRLHVGKGIFVPRVLATGAEDASMAALRGDYEATGGSVVEHAEPFQLFPGVWLTGLVPRVHPERNFGVGRMRGPQGPVDDTVPEDLSLVVDTERGLVVLVGCGHAGIVNTLVHARRFVREAPIHALVGGFHLFALDDERLAWTGEKLREAGVENLVGAHCTGIEAVYRLRERLGLARPTAVVGAVGASFELGRGIDPLPLAR
jgi:7,8-dihydropterin-6-yl-methyl-4-(beta-D-ribofuranosyl)aminobenzene 5'-phosphate synthase